MENKRAVILGLAVFAAVLVAATGAYALTGPAAGQSGSYGAAMGPGGSHGMLSGSGQHMRGSQVDAPPMMHYYAHNYTHSFMHEYLWNYCNFTTAP